MDTQKKWFILFVLILALVSPTWALIEEYSVPMRDGVELSTLVYRPAGDQAYPVVLYRTPYNKYEEKLPDPFIFLLNARGLTYVIQDTRGRYASSGIDSVFLSDGWGRLQDGYDTIDWIAQQEWCNGRIGQFGASANGITTLRAAGALHPNLLVAVPLVAPTDFYNQVIFPGGEYRKAIVENWLNGQESDYMIDYFMQYPYYNAFWQLMDVQTRYSLIQIPMMHIGGWYDCFSEGTIDAFQGLSASGVAGPQRLIMGPWVHETTGSNTAVGEMQYPDAFFDIITSAILWLDYFLTGVDNGILDEPPVQYYLLGDPLKTNEPGCEWIEAEQWPPENSNGTTVYLTTEGTLQFQDVPESGILSFDYDPANPVPTLGGNNLTISRGPYDQKELNGRSDVLCFSSDVLTEPIRVEGTISAKLYVSSNCPDTDFTVKLVDVYPDGREMLVTDAIQRLRFRNGVTENDVTLLTPGEMATVTVTLPPTAIVFNTGHSMKICVSSSNYPRYEINPNTANALYDLSTKQIASNTVNLGGQNASCVYVPIVTESSVVARDIRPKQSGISIQNYPNPFNNSTTLAFEFDKPSEYRIHLYNNRGQLVRHLAHDFGSGGQHQVKWDGKDNSGLVVASGFYFARIVTSAGIQQTHKMLLIQ